MTTTKKKRRYALEFKEEAVKLVTEQGYSVTEAARNLDIHPNLLGKWRRAYEDGEDQGYSGPGEKAALQTELGRLKKENRRLRMEREILKKAAAFFAKESS
jgi:transposase